MFSLGNSLQRLARAGQSDTLTALLVALFMLVLIAPSAFAQSVTHVTNPFAGATFYVNPDWTNEVNSASAAQPAGSALAKQMAVVGTYPTAVWLDRIAAISGGN